VKRRILVGCGTAAIVLGSLSVAAPASADGCPYGTVPTRFPGVCTAGQGGGSPAQVVVPPSAGGGGAAVTTLPGSGLTSVDGIPCTPEHQGTCIGLSQNAH
jgi:hypothetical protein